VDVGDGIVGGTEVDSGNAWTFKGGGGLGGVDAGLLDCIDLPPGMT